MIIMKDPECTTTYMETHLFTHLRNTHILLQFSVLGLSSFGSSGANNRVTSAPPKLTHVPDVTQQQQQQQVSHHSNVSEGLQPMLCI